jgi:hypothetical protein
MGNGFIETTMGKCEYWEGSGEVFLPGPHPQSASHAEGAHANPPSISVGNLHSSSVVARFQSE